MRSRFQPLLARRLGRGPVLSIRLFRAVLPIMLFVWIILAGDLNPGTLPKAHAQESGTAMLAVVGTDGNLSILDASGQNPFAVTKDAIPNRRSYGWPTWATDGRLAFFGS